MAREIVAWKEVMEWQVELRTRMLEECGAEDVGQAIVTRDIVMLSRIN